MLLKIKTLESFNPLIFKDYITMLFQTKLPFKTAKASTFTAIRIRSSAPSYTCNKTSSFTQIY